MTVHELVKVVSLEGAGSFLVIDQIVHGAHTYAD
jgi:hypothetical protein